MEYVERVDSWETRFWKVGILSERKSAGRIIDDLKKYPFLIITAYRDDNPRRLNKRLLQQLIGEIRRETGIGAIGVKGVGQEIEDGVLKQAVERSALFLARDNSGITAEDLKRIGFKYADKYNQSGFVVGDGNGKYYLYLRDWNSSEGKWEEWQEPKVMTQLLKSIGVFYTSVHGSPFHLESLEFYGGKFTRDAGGVLAGMLYNGYELFPKNEEVE